MVNGKEQRIGRLKAYESFCYSICLHLLKLPCEAERAATLCLKRLFHNDSFHLLVDQRFIEHAIRREAAICSLQIRQQSLAAD